MTSHGKSFFSIVHHLNGWFKINMCPRLMRLRDATSMPLVKSLIFKEWSKCIKHSKLCLRWKVSCGHIKEGGCRLPLHPPGILAKSRNGSFNFFLILERAWIKFTMIMVKTRDDDLVKWKPTEAWLQILHKWPSWSLSLELVFKISGRNGHLHR